MPSSTLHMFAGPIASGKSTLAKNLSEQDHTVLISEDTWLSSLYGDEMKTLNDYKQFSARLRHAMAQHLTMLLCNDISISLDFPANTISNRKWMSGIIEASGCNHVLHVFEVPLETCRTRMHNRFAQGLHPFQVTDEQFDRISRLYEPIEPSENFNVQHHPEKE